MAKKAKKNVSATLNDVFILKLRSLLDVENQLIKALPKMAKKSTDSELKSGFEKHAKQTEGHAQRLEQSFEILQVKPQKLQVEAIRGLVKDAEWVMKNVKGKEALDASMIAAAQYVEHYEMAGYGSACEWAKLLGYDEIANLLGETLKEEEKTDQELNTLAEGKVNEKALSVE